MSLRKHLGYRGIWLIGRRKMKQTRCLPRDEDYFDWPRAVLFEVQRVTLQRRALVPRNRHRTETLASAGSCVVNT
jgi:hypothetical protein